MLSASHTPTPGLGSAQGSTAAALDDRYGRTPGRRRRSVLIAVAAAIVIVVVFTVWVIWAGPGQTDHGLDSEDVGYHVQSDRATLVHSQVSVDPGNRVDCAVQVLDKSFTIVGWKVVDLPASTQRTTSIDTVVKTSSRGVTGLINTCWIP
ncbi:DUF4307 domain-containing protein [Curtobacterium sp. MCBD17_003]|uniref:DUF4307 domain-containing protein n=1 Tax=Curtobacterium sp. MCBD17_003 TaxID=2175667 RepID=UPI000DA981F6|nr:DUF4307 domain-containing protein [Curtobacterium sp. MCBD17_003]WIE53916.1 DUF4307 domain-containing protein [Curtobacterium sp. MCBD17_003]